MAEADQENEDGSVLIDFATGAPSPVVAYVGRLPFGSLTFSRCTLEPNPGLRVGSDQVTIAMHDGTPFEMEWQIGADDKIQRRRITRGDIHVNDAGRAPFQRWSARPRIVVFALDRSFVSQTVVEAFGAEAGPLRTEIGVRDPTLGSLMDLLTQELEEQGAGGRLYAESLGTAATVHLFRRYADSERTLLRIRGGLATYQFRQVADYIEANLASDISLPDLARLAKLSTHHFGQAFKRSTGLAPHRYLIERRVHRAKELLIGTNGTIAGIAMRVGFSSHSHLTLNFRKLTGATPSRFREDAK